jgi:hypothetical protein
MATPTAVTVTATPATAASTEYLHSTAQSTTSAPSVATAESTAYSCPFVNIESCTGSGHSLGAAAGVGVAVGATVASIIIGAFFFFRRRQTRARKISPTIAPDVLVRGPLDHDRGEWEEYREESKDVVQGSGVLKHNEPPTYMKSV